MLALLIMASIWMNDRSDAYNRPGICFWLKYTFCNRPFRPPPKLDPLLQCPGLPVAEPSWIFSL